VVHRRRRAQQLFDCGLEAGQGGRCGATGRRRNPWTSASARQVRGPIGMGQPIVMGVRVLIGVVVRGQCVVSCRAEWDDGGGVVAIAVVMILAGRVGGVPNCRAVVSVWWWELGL
jgi:hypothetical protein